MREILFRGKRLDNGEWVEGNLLILDGGEYRIATSCLQGDNENLLTVCAYPVDPSTVGQYTGLEDMHGKRIFEGDIIKTKQFGRQIPGSNRVNFNGYDIFTVVYEEGRYKIDNFSRNFILAGLHGSYECEVIGNIHDNPELLEGGQDNG